jgi:hypothetical protein
VHDHLVEFYETDALLVESVRDFVSPGLKAGEPVIVVATPEHGADFTTALELAGFDVPEHRRLGLLVELDASETLAKFMVDGSPEPSRFETVIGGLVESAGKGNHKLRIYGEMVSLLWDDGRRDAALKLENLWNHLASRYRFTLLCAYPLASMEWGPNTAPFRGICSSHSSVRVRFSAPVADLPVVMPAAKGDQYSQARGLGSELNALKEVIRNANQMGRLAENTMSVSKSGPDGLDYNLTP